MSQHAHILLTIRQLLRFGIVGLISNGILYVGYLLLTGQGVSPKVAMTILFIIGVLQTFVFNKKWTFESQGDSRSSLIRYFSVYFSAYLLNLLILEICVDRMGWPHQIVQAAATLAMAAYLFVVQKIWVFKPQATQSLQES